jgi:uncharacterized protein (DUF302 family)
MRLLAAALFALLLAGTPVLADQGYPYPGTNVLPTKHSFGQLWERLEQAISDNEMGLVGRASASVGASRRKVTIPGNAVFGVYRNDFAVRMLKASVTAGIEAPLRFYLTENADGTATLAYRSPSAVFKPYGSAALDAMARELDAIFAAIAKQASGP